MLTLSSLLLSVFQVQWVSWMKYAPNVVITRETNYTDILVPTADTVRFSFLVDMLLTNKKPVSTLTVALWLVKNDAITEFSHYFSYTTYCNCSSTFKYAWLFVWARCCVLGQLAQGRHWSCQTSCWRTCLLNTSHTSLSSLLAPQPIRLKITLTTNWTKGAVDHYLQFIHLQFIIYTIIMHVWLTILIVPVCQAEGYIRASNREALHLLHRWPEHAHVGDLRRSASHWTAAAVDGSWWLVWQKADRWEHSSNISLTVLATAVLQHIENSANCDAK